jgi:hypothetical protein
LIKLVIIKSSRLIANVMAHAENNDGNKYGTTIFKKVLILEYPKS